MLLRRIGLAVFAGMAALTGLGFLLAAADTGLQLRFQPWVAAAIIAGFLLVVAGILLLYALHRPRTRRLGPAEVVLAAVGLAARSVRASPEKAMIAALIAGVLSEWLGERGATKLREKK
ncbi:MAG: phage holin family protein [Acetobacteraceae bacterium]